MRIALFVATFPSVSETFILRQITGLVDAGHEVDVYAEARPEPSEPMHEEVERYGLLSRTTYVGEHMPAASGAWELPAWPVRGETWVPGAEQSIPNEHRLLQAVPTLVSCLSRVPGLTLRALDPEEYGVEASSLSALYRLSVLISTGKPYDVLHAHFGPVGRTYRFARELFRAPLVITFHGYDFTAVPFREGPNCYRHLFADADAVTVNSDYARRRVEALGCPPERISRLNVGIEVAGFPFRERRLDAGEPVRLLTVARLVEKKGIEYALRAVACVLPRHPGLRYDIVGDGPLRGRLARLAEELGVQGHVRFHGAQPSDAVRRRMAEAHLFLLPSVTAVDGDQEGTPVSLMEAQATGLPILSTLHSGIPEVVLDGQSGFLAPERDVQALADRLVDLVTHPQRWAEMGRRGREHVVANFDLKDLNPRLIALYSSIGSKGRPSTG